MSKAFSLANRAIDTVSVLDFGAKGDGVTDDAPAFEAACKAVSLAGGGDIYIPAGTYLFGTSSTDPNAAYSYVVPRNNVSFYGAGIGATTIKIKSGENARFSGTTGPNVFGTGKAGLLQNCTFKDFTIEWSSGNLLTSLDTARNNASFLTLNGAKNIICENIETKYTPGNQCILFSCTTSSGEGNISLINCSAISCGSGLVGNYNVDHSSFYCNGSNLHYERLFGTATQTVNGALYEIHGSNSVAISCSSNYYERACWIASNYEAIKNINVTDDSHTNVKYAFSISAATYAVDNVNVTNSVYNQISGATLVATPYFINGNTIAACSSLEISNCKFIGANYASCRFLHQYKIASLKFINNICSGFGAYGILGVGLDIGGSKFANEVLITGNYFYDVIYAIYYNIPSLSGTNITICNNSFERSTAEATAAIAFTALSSTGLIGPNIFSSTYSTPITGNPNGAEIYNYSDGTWLPILTGGTTPGTCTYSVQEGTYTKVGNIVIFNLTVKWTGHTGVGQMVISLPVTSKSGLSGYNATSIVTEGITLTAGRYPGALVIPAGSVIRTYEFQTGGALAALNIAASGSLYISGSYVCANP